MMLALLLAVPLFSGLMSFGLKDRAWALAIAFAVVLANSAVLFYCFNAGITEYRAPWLPEWGLYFHVRLDGLSLFMLLSTHLMALLALFAAKEVITAPGFYFGNLLVLLAGINGVLLAADLLLFFICWEAMILPLYFLIWFFGQGDHRRSAMQFFIFTQASGLLMLTAIIGLYFIAYAQIGVFSFDPELLTRVMLDEPIEIMLALGFLLAFLVKLPACPFHVWLADLFCDAKVGPLLLGIMVKTGAYAIIRFVLDLFPHASLALAPYMITLGLFSLFYGAFLAFSQTDIRKILAYATVSHMGLVLIALFCHHELARTGAIIMLLTGGIATGSILLLTSELKRHDLKEVGGLFALLPKTSVVMIFLVMSSLGLPLFGSFVGEWLVVVGAYATSKALAILIALALVASAAYHLRLLKLLVFGQSHGAQSIPELSKSRMLLYGGLIGALLFIGLYPSPLLSLLAQKNFTEREGNYD